MTLNDYSLLVAKHGEEWVKKMFPRSVKDLQRRVNYPEIFSFGVVHELTPLYTQKKVSPIITMNETEKT